MNAEIKTLTLEIGEREIVLTLEEAESLYTALSRVFVRKCDAKPYPVYIERDLYYWRTDQPLFVTNESTAMFDHATNSLTVQI